MNIICKAYKYLWLHGWKYRAIERQHAKYVEQLQGRTVVRVVFMALDVALWRYQRLYELMVADKRFEPTIVLSPCPLRENPEKDADGLRQYFNSKGISFVDYHHGESPYDIRAYLHPDIIFFTQPYEYLLSPEHDCRAFYDILVAYIPYGFNTFANWAYNLHFCNLAWRLYYPMEESLMAAKKLAWNKGRNVRISGYANADEYLSGNYQNVWKELDDGNSRKRIIWAPHFTIYNDSKTIPPRSNFLWMADLMLQLAQEYKDKLQITFKPHPALMTQLIKHADWGKEKAERYYQQWASMSNTQLETGSYTDLFMTSDAMIHDCASFSAEYHYSRKPVMFVSKDITPILNELNDCGKEAIGVHYIGSVEADIRSFIEQQVLAGDDPMKAQREEFFQNYLLPPNGKSVAQNVIDDLVESLQL